MFFDLAYSTFSPDIYYYYTYILRLTVMINFISKTASSESGKNDQPEYDTDRLQH